MVGAMLGGVDREDEIGVDLGFKGREERGGTVKRGGGGRDTAK
jgi:hypothetical protein